MFYAVCAILIKNLLRNAMISARQRGVMPICRAGMLGEIAGGKGRSLSMSTRDEQDGTRDAVSVSGMSEDYE